MNEPWTRTEKEELLKRGEAGSREPGDRLRAETGP